LYYKKIYNSQFYPLYIVIVKWRFKINLKKIRKKVKNLQFQMNVHWEEKIYIKSKNLRYWRFKILLLNVQFKKDCAM